MVTHLKSINQAVIMFEIKMAGITIFLLMIITSSNLFITPSHQFSYTTDMITTTPQTTFLQFYFYDKVSNPDATAVPIASGPNTTSPISFSRLTMIDDALLASPRLKNPEIIGRAQGMYGGASTRTPGLVMVVNYVFTTGKYNGSSLSVLGHNEVLQNPREMPIVGGTGLFRFAQGFALARTVWFNLTTFDAMVQYNVTVYHYAQS